MRLRFESWAALAAIVLSGLAACGDDDATGGAGGTTGNSSSGSGTSSASTKSASSATTSASASTADTSSSNTSSTTATTDASSSVSASSTSTGQNLQLCGVDDPGGTVENCDPTTQYCEEMNGGIVASQQFTCQPKPAECAGAPTCACVAVQGCDCTMDGQMVHITCNFP